MSGKKEITIKLIIDTAIKQFSLYGYSSATTASIAKEAGISEAVIFKYFKSKDNLLKEISKIAISQIMENISIIPFLKNIEESKDYPLRDFVYSIIKERLEFLDRNHELVKLLIIEMQYSEGLKKQTRELIFPKVSEVFNYVRQVLAKKSGGSDSRASAVLKMIIGIIEFVFIQKYMLDVEFSDKEIGIEIEEVLNVIEKGCRE